MPTLLHTLRSVSYSTVKIRMW